MEEPARQLSDDQDQKIDAQWRVRLKLADRPAGQAEPEAGDDADHEIEEEASPEQSGDRPPLHVIKGGGSDNTGPQGNLSLVEPSDESEKEEDDLSSLSDAEANPEDEAQPQDNQEDNQSEDATADSANNGSQVTPLGEPAKPVYDESGNQPESKKTSPGQPAKKQSPGEKAPSLQSLSDKESSAGGAAAAGSLYKKANPNLTKTRATSLRGYITRRRAIFGGGLLGTIVGIIFFFTLSSGPLEFVHIAELLQQFHFASLQNNEDDRFTKAVRLYRYSSQGQIENTRLGFLGNKFANKFETKLNKSGLTSSYTDKFGLFNGYVVDESEFKNPDGSQMSENDIKDTIKSKYGVDVVDGSTIQAAPAEIKGKLVIDASNLGYLDTYKLNFGLLQEAGYSKLSAAIGARYLCARAACTSLLHPLTKSVGNSKRALEDWWDGRNKTDKQGAEPGQETPEDDSPQEDGEPIAEEISSEEASPGSATDISAKLSAGGAAALGLLCLARGIAGQAHTLKAGQVQVLMRMGVESLALGSQVQSGNDVNLAQLSQYDTLLSGKDAEGNNTNWNQSESIQANLGNQKTGEPPDPTLTDVTNDDTPFSFLLNGAVGAALGTVCGTVGTIIQIIAGGLTGALQSIVFGAVLAQTHLADDLANWLAGSVINVDAVGADFGSEIDYGAALAANGQAMLAGGNSLSGAQSAAIQSTVNQVAQDQFDHQSVLHKLFSPYDEKSAISKVIDNTSPSPVQNFAKLGSLFNLKYLFSSLSSVFSGRAHAASAGFDYGFPTLGFSESDMTSQTYANPYENACYVTGCSAENAPGGSKPIVGFLTGSSVDGAPADSTGQTYIAQAKACFGANISQDTVQTDQGQATQWNVTSSSGDMPNPYDDNYPKDCNDNTDQNWTRLRFFIMDTETMNSMGCYAGDDQACSDIGFGDSQPTSFAGSPISFAGNSAL